MGYRSNGLVRAGVAACAGAILSGVLLVGPIVPTVAADATIGTTTSLGPSSVNPKPVGRTSDITATLALDSGAGPTGTMTLYDDNGGTRTQIAQKPADLIVQFTLAADMTVGTYHLVAVYSGDATFIESESAEVTITVGPRPTSTTVAISGPHDGTGATAQKGDTIVVTPTVLDTGDHLANDIAVVGDVTIEVDGALKGTTTPGVAIELSTAAWTLGSHTVKATYAGDGTDHSGSNGSVSITILANVVEASGVGVSATTFYPFKDGYKDTVAIRGNRGEPISVVIRIYSPAGSQVRTFSFAAGSGAYSFAWNGRNTAGAALAAGKYKIVQTLTDTTTPKATKAFTSFVTISSKRLYTYSQTFTKSYTQVSKRTATWLAWSFTLPSATVYKSLIVSIYGRDLAGSGGFGPHDFSYCSAATWHPICVTRYRTFPTTASWRSLTASVRYDRSGRTVREYAWGGSGNTQVKYARIKITYAILK